MKDLHALLDQRSEGLEAFYRLVNGPGKLIEAVFRFGVGA
jgi:hypothetical protein